MFSPDLMAVADVAIHQRNSWIVSHEGRGLSFVMEVPFSSHRKKDLDDNVKKYARLGIPEYFIFDLREEKLIGYRLPASGPPQQDYQRLLPEKGLYYSAVLDLDIMAEGKRLRFFHGTAEIHTNETYLELMVNSLVDAKETAEKRAQQEAQWAQEEARRAQEEARRAQEEARRADQEAQRAHAQAQRAEEAERRLQEALAEIKKLKDRQSPPEDSN
jgi:hypothetical protein